MIGSSLDSSSQLTQSAGIAVGSVEQAVATLGIRLEQLGAQIVDLESSIYQILRQDNEGGAKGTCKPTPSTPLAARLEELVSGIDNLTNRVESIRSRVDI